MKAPYSMKVNGVWIAAGEEIPPDSFSENNNEAPKKKYTKKEIIFMKVADLRDLAKKEGLVENPDNFNGTELKDMLCKHYEL